jgi:uncharacterized membrane-anchored protein
MNENSSIGGFDLDSKFWRILMVIVAVFLIFIGPTYVSYLLSDVLRVDYVASVVVGLVLFALGLALIIFLTRKKILD